MSRALRPRATIDPECVEQWMQEGRAREVSAKSLHDGTWLFRAAEENAKTCGEMSGHPLFPSRSLTWGSCCSGSEGILFCFEVLNRLACKMGSNVCFEHVISCESNPEKMQWISAVTQLAPEVTASIEADYCSSECPRPPGGLSAGHCCLFKDICELGESHAACVVHKHESRNAVTEDGVRNSEKKGKVSDREKLPEGHCYVPQVDILVLGTSCKDMSRANHPKSSARGSSPSSLVLTMEHSKGGSAQTFRGMLRYCEKNSPAIVIFENVDAIDDRQGGNSNLDILLADAMT